MVWLTKNCSNANLLPMVLFADAFLPFEFPDKLEASKGFVARLCSRMALH